MNARIFMIFYYLIVFKIYLFILRTFRMFLLFNFQISAEWRCVYVKHSLSPIYLFYYSIILWDSLLILSRNIIAAASKLKKTFLFT